MDLMDLMDVMDLNGRLPEAVGVGQDRILPALRARSRPSIESIESIRSIRSTLP